MGVRFRQLVSRAREWAGCLSPIENLSKKRPVVGVRQNGQLMSPVGRSMSSLSAQTVRHCALKI